MRSPTCSADLSANSKAGKANALRQVGARLIRAVRVCEPAVQARPRCFVKPRAAQHAVFQSEHHAYNTQRTGATAAEAQVSAVWQVGGKLAAATPSQFIPCSPAIIEWIAKQATEAYPEPLLRSNMVINYIQEIKREHARILLQACSPFARSFAGVLAAPAAP